MNYAIFAATAVACAITPFCCQMHKHGWKRGDKLLKILSLCLFAVFALRFLSYRSGLDGVTLHVVTQESSPILSKGRAILAFLVEWISLPVAILLCLKAFYSIKTVDRLVLFLAPIYCVLAIVGMDELCIESFRVTMDKPSLSGISFAVELGLCLFLTAFYWVKGIMTKEIPWFKEWKGVGFFALAILLIAVVSLPTYWYAFLFNLDRKTLSFAKDFKLYHRLFIYGAIVIPFAAYFALRKQDKRLIKFVLLYFSLVAMFSYSYAIQFSALFSDPGAWPLHLCNTAMFLVPLCLVFKLNKLFYFTYFINVFGALLAMFMPNYDNLELLLSARSMQFWYNHYCAFFMPLLLVALGIYERPTVKQFRYSIVGFCMYFALALLMNVICRGFGYDVDYFFLAGDHIAGTLGRWAEDIYDKTWILTLGGKEFLFRPLYQVLFFGIYVIMGLGVWFVYEIGFSIAESSAALTAKRQKIKLDEYALSVALGDRSIEEPMYETTEVKLALKHFSKKYATSKQYAVNDANLEVYGGEIFGFLGPNGAGKSTIIKSIVGIQPITEGGIEICGYDCEKQPVQAKRLIGYVPDHYALYEKLTGREYINYIADIYDVSQEDRTRRIERHIKMFELEGAIDNPIKTYSHGMKQKITIMAALVHNPKLWILDEPLTGLDPNSIHQVKECMKEHAAKGNIVFFSSHIIDVVERICNRITIIKKGKIMVTKTIEEVEKECPLEEFYLKTIGGESEQQ